jgi:hypothetical protein
MKYPIRWIAVGILIIILSGTGAIQAADFKDGFMGILWRTDLSASADFVKISEDGNVSNFIKPSVIHTVGDVKVYPVVFSCFANQFFAVYFQNDIIIFSRLRTYFNQLFGTSRTTTRMNPSRTIHTWNHQDVKISLKLLRETTKIKLSIYYTSLSEKINEQRLEAAQEKTRRFLDRIDKDRAIEMFDMMR